MVAYCLTAIYLFLYNVKDAVESKNSMGLLTLKSTLGSYYEISQATTASSLD